MVSCIGPARPTGPARPESARRRGHRGAGRPPRPQAPTSADPCPAGPTARDVVDVAAEDLCRPGTPGQGTDFRGKTWP